uniref:Acetyl-CoA hydrolase n=1 Tax=Ditylenchus dipsaci TaxID=166011 RepID=A0A915CTC5_9BILA
MLSRNSVISSGRKLSTSLRNSPKTAMPVGKNRSYPIAGKSPAVKEMKDAFEQIKSGDNIFVHAIAATPHLFWMLHHLHLEGPTSWTKPDVRDRIRSNSCSLVPTFVKLSGMVSLTSIRVSCKSCRFCSGAIKLNAALINVSPPDANGYCSLGTSCEAAPAAIEHADFIIAMANSNVPRTFGDGLIHSSHIDVIVHQDFPLHVRNFGQVSEVETKIGQLIAENLVDDGSTLQMGIGAVPDAALAALKNHRDLGIHTEMFSDGILPLVECNAITNSKKFHHPGKMSVSFVYGSKKLYDFLHDNPFVNLLDVQWVNDPAVIRQNPKVTAINSAVEVDLTGQVDKLISSEVLGLEMTAWSKIVPYIQEGAGVVTSRAHVHYVVTEYGIAQLWGKNMRQRAYELIKIAHPNNREALEKAAFDRLKVMPSSD